MKEALFYGKKSDGTVVCRLCPHSCHIVKGRNGFCRARKNVDGTLIAESYGRVVSLHLDPIEKKPLFRFHPGTMILSAGSYGCNMKCPFCQNYEISQRILKSDFVSGQDLLNLAKKDSRNIGIAFTYNEPTMSFEYIMDNAPLFKKEGFKVVLVTNGMIRSEPLNALIPFIDAVNIDVKVFNTSKYKSIGGSLATVIKTVEVCVSAGIHVEVTSLIVPGLNDSPEEMRMQAKWLAGISPEIPLHISRFFPNYKMIDCNPTPVQTLEKLAEVAREYLKHVYLGNV